MKNLSLALNAILFVLVGVLFYLHFSNKNKSVAPQVIQTNGKTVSVPQIAYIDIDSFQNGYTYFKNGKAALKQNKVLWKLSCKEALAVFKVKLQHYNKKQLP